MTKKSARGRRKPYTEIGISRIPCAKCGDPSSHQWQICANGNQFQGLCDRCDVGLNALVLRWIGHPRAEQLIRKYSEPVRRKYRNAASLAYEAFNS